MMEFWHFFVQGGGGGGYKNGLRGGWGYYFEGRGRGIL